MNKDQARRILKATQWEWGIGTDYLLTVSHDDLEEDMKLQPIDGVSLDELEQALNYVRRDPRVGGVAGMKPREEAIMDYTRRMGEIDLFHADTLASLTRELLNYLQNGRPRSRVEREMAEQQWQQSVLDAYHHHKEHRIKAEAELDAALAADPAIES